MLHLPRAEYETLRQHGQQTYPQECCGVLLGAIRDGDRHVSAVVRTENIRVDSANNRYLIAPEDLIRIQREARLQGLEIVGFYHSHPDQSAQWSQTDLAEAHWLTCSYVITRVSKGQPAETRSFVLTGVESDAARFEEEQIEIVRTDAPGLSTEEMARYSRQILLPQVGVAGQQKLRAARVLCVGVGGLGSPVAMYLAAAGVGTLGLVDFDVVDASNLHRQILHSTADIGRSKLDSAEAHLQALNPNVAIVKFSTRLNRENAHEILRDFDVGVDGSDNFSTRYVVNDACVALGKPNVYASIDRFEGQASIFAAPNGPCYRCLYPEPPAPGVVPTCEEGGVLGVLPGLLGMLQATEVLKLILGIGELLIGRLLLVDALSLRFREISLPKNPACPVCGTHPKETFFMNEQHTSTKPTPSVNGIAQMEPGELKHRLDAGENIFILDVREPKEFAAAQIGGHLIPMNDLPQRVGEVDREKMVVVHCKLGGRSQKAAEFLAQAGFKNLFNLAGGIQAWSEKVDPKVPKY